MASCDAFLQAIRAEPAEDAHRLVYADWLDDHGDADRAEFVRVQCALEGLAEDDPACAALKERERALLAAHRAEWIGALPAEVRECDFRRGFVDRLVLRDTTALPAVEHVLLREPVHALVLESGGLAELGRWPSLALVRSVSVGSAFSRRQAREVDRFFGSANLTKLTELELWGEAIDNYTAEVLADAPFLCRLTTLRLHQTALSDAGLMRLLRGPALAGLTGWHVAGPRLSSVGMAQLLSPGHAARWSDLSWFTGRYIRPLNLRDFQGCVNLRRLHLALPFLAETSPAGLFPRPPALRELSLHVREGIWLTLLGDWPGLARLDSLRVQLGDLSPEALRPLAASPHLRAGTRLSLPGLTLPSEIAELFRARLGQGLVA
jgi:uncharacterized protein (TIGR02996 family)